LTDRRRFGHCGIKIGTKDCDSPRGAIGQLFDRDPQRDWFADQFWSPKSRNQAQDAATPEQFFRAMSEEKILSILSILSKNRERYL
jgi:hypothetical protein